MTKKEISEKFPFAKDSGFFGNCGVCTLCSYFETCDKMLPGFTKPRKCFGPFVKSNELIKK